MRKACLAIVLLASTMMTLSSNAAAQGGELFGGYSYLRASTGSGYNSSGWEGSLTGNFNRFFGLEANISDHYGTPPGLGFYSDGLTFLFGPHFAYRSTARLNPFAHFLVGGTRGTEVPLFAPCPSPGCPPQGPLHQTAFTTGVGGGLDLKATRFVWIRMVQADYLREYFSRDTQNDVRLSFGLVLHLAAELGWGGVLAFLSRGLGHRLHHRVQLVPVLLDKGGVLR